MKEQQKKTTEPCADPYRAAYMIAWRDRYIEGLQERLAGREEENRMLSTLLFYALSRLALANGEGTVHIPVAEVAELLGRWQCHSESAGECYAVHFKERAEDPDAKESHKA